jgi:hypothetical protein
MWILHTIVELRDRWLTVSVVAAGMLLAAGCGRPETRDTEARVVRETIGAYFRAIEEGDGAATCSNLTQQTQRAIAELQKMSCQKAMTDEARRLPQAFNGYDVTAVNVNGGHAAVRLNERTTGLEEQMKLRRFGGGWKISDAPGLGQ